MKVTLITVGKVKESYFKDSIDEYVKRLRLYCNFEKIELPDEKIIESKPDSFIKDKEAEKILKVLNMESYKIALSERGKQFTSKAFSEIISKQKNQGLGNITFIIGGALGLSNDVVAKADFHLSLSDMTLPHQIAQLFLVEQVYRAFKIMNNEPYHK